MSNVKDLIGEYMSGDAWENLCVKCYHMRYQDENYMEIPAAYDGDAGIEGFTKNGIVHQCYCPEGEYSNNDLFYHQRDKVTKDIKKLLQNADKLQKLGVPPVKQWHFNIPEYKDSRIVKHIAKKEREVLKLREENPAQYKHIDDDFQIVIKTAEDFALEISRVIRTSVADMQLNLAVKHSNTPDWNKCDSEKVGNIRRKIKAVMNVDDDDDTLKELVNIYIDYYICGLEILNNLRISFPEIWENIYQLEQSYKREVKVKTLLNTDRSMNITLFNDIINGFQEKLEKDFSPQFTEASIGELKQDMIAGWLADCSMEFRS